MNDIEKPKGQPDVFPAALFGLCPHCGQKTLFRGVTAFAHKCRACGLDYDQYNVGDGPAAFLTLIVGGIIVALALIVELNFEPPMWVHVILWVPLTVAAVVGSLRVSKGILLILEHRNQAREGSIDGGGQE
ncbi:MAG: DUF983 domain-containing protein [Sphingorhabdus sp.]|nr:DUF983 domain-containing protein [Sphingorhabdus sp.]